MADELPLTMRAAQWTTTSGGIGKNLKVNSEAAPPKNAGKLPTDHTLVKVLYTSLNPIDYKLAETLPFIFSKPATPCLDFAGKVITSRLPHLRPGELVFGKTDPPAFGCLGTYITTSATNIAPLPPKVSPQQAACVGIAGLTAYQCLEPYVKQGSKVLINGGSGGTGTFGIQIAKCLGASEVTVVCSGGNAEMCKELGADHVIDYRTQDVIAELKRSGRQYDVVVDNVFASAQLYWACGAFLKPEGPFITIAGTPSVSSVVSIMSAMLWPTMLGGGTRQFKFVTNNGNAEMFVKIAGWMAEGKVKAIVEREYELEEAGAAFERLKTGHVRGKLVVKVAAE